MFIAFTLQQRLRQRASMYRSTYIAFLVFDDDVLLNIWLIIYSRWLRLIKTKATCKVPVLN